MTVCLTQEKEYLRTERMNQMIVLTERCSGSTVSFLMDETGFPISMEVNGKKSDLRFLIAMDVQQLKQTYPEILWQEVIQLLQA